MFVLQAMLHLVRFVGDYKSGNGIGYLGALRHVALVVGRCGHLGQGAHEVVEVGEEAERDVRAAFKGLLPQGKVLVRHLVVVAALKEQGGYGG